MRETLQWQDIINTISIFTGNNDGDEATQRILYSLGCELLGVSMFEYAKLDCFCSENVASETLESWIPFLTKEELEEILQWTGDDEFVMVTDDKEIVSKTPIRPAYGVYVNPNKLR